MQDYQKLADWLRWLLVVYALHSSAVAIGLIFIPSTYFSLFGFANCQDGFFKAQAGVFHFVMAAAYYLGSRKLDASHFLILFIIIAKFIALLFLALYFILVDQVWMIALSGIIDGAMALALYLLYSKYRAQRSNRSF